MLPAQLIGGPELIVLGLLITGFALVVGAVVGSAIYMYLDSEEE